MSEHVVGRPSGPFVRLVPCVCFPCWRSAFFRRRQALLLEQRNPRLSWRSNLKLLPIAVGNRRHHRLLARLRRQDHLVHPQRFAAFPRPSRCLFHCPFLDLSPPFRCLSAAFPLPSRCRILDLPTDIQACRSGWPSRSSRSTTPRRSTRPRLCMTGSGSSSSESAKVRGAEWATEKGHGVWRLTTFRHLHSSGVHGCVASVVHAPPGAHLFSRSIHPDKPTSIQVSLLHRVVRNQRDGT